MSENNDRHFEKAYKRGIIITTLLAVFLAGSIIFSAIQTIYIYKLNTGRTGNLDYINTNTVSGQTQELKHVDTSNLPDPWFSLEEAASVSDPDKQKLSVTEIVDLVSPSTISLYIKGKVNGVNKTLSAGSGFIITDTGYAVTNAHVVDDVTADSGLSLFASVPGSNELIACEVVGKDIQTDCAVIKLTADITYPYVTLGSSSNLRPGELAVAIGNALGTLDGTVTVGVVSATDRQINHEGYRLNVLQTDAAINSGNSGGPLINSFGEVIGITNAKMVVSSSEGLGFAIPIDEVKTVIESLINYGVVVNRAYLGVTMTTVTADSYYGAEPGVYVYEYVEGGPADQAGLKIGDKIISIDGVAINVSDDIIDIRNSHNVGDVVEFVVERDGKQLTIEFTIGDSADYEDAGTVSSEERRTDVFGGDR
ncbi:MAG: trypsin-like peptidase domain-containing protein [Clostridiales bacterium]|nr:trypsin-like peptidase domain-containing protein [Clostridiales bacterium]